MTSVNMVMFFIFLFFISAAEGEKEKKMDKIVIHVPYKIHKHHHTHTKYKIITIPEAKKENTVIYLKEKIQPTKQIPTVQIQSDVIETQSKTPELFMSPHQESAAALLDSLANQKEENVIQTDQQHYYNEVANDQKSLESYSGQNTNNFVPNFTFRPILFSSHENLVPNFSFKPAIFPQPNMFAPKLLLNPIMHPSYKAFLPKFTYQPILQLPEGQFDVKYTLKPVMHPSKVLHDSVHTSSQVYKSIIPPKPRATSYKVKEENQEDHKMQMVSNQHIILNKTPVSPMKSIRKGKNFASQEFNYPIKDIKSAVQYNPDYEYEHVGYLIIDGNSRKIVGKNFKDEFHLSN